MSAIGQPNRSLYDNKTVYSLLPLTAIGFYAAALALGLEWRTNWIAYLITTPLGFILLIFSLVRVWQMKEHP